MPGKHCCSSIFDFVLLRVVGLEGVRRHGDEPAECMLDPRVAHEGH
jgi:hypothetical protein